MAFVEDDFKLYTITQRSDGSLNKYYKAFKSQGDIINTHGGRAGFHQGLYKEHLLKANTEKGVSKEAFKALPKGDAGKKATILEAGKTSREAYLACLILLMADGSGSSR